MAIEDVSENDAWVSHTAELEPATQHSLSGLLSQSTSQGETARKRCFRMMETKVKP